MLVLPARMSNDDYHAKAHCGNVKTRLDRRILSISDTEEATTPHRSLLADSPAIAHPAEQESIGGLHTALRQPNRLYRPVSNFFVHQPLDIRDNEKAQLWLMRFRS